MKTVAARVDIVGSLLRPPWLKDARERYAAGEISAAEFKWIEDDAVEGFGEPSIEAYLWGDWRGGEEVGDKLIARPE